MSTDAERQTAFREAHPRYTIKYTEGIRREVLSHYSGGTLQCAHCGAEDIRVLEIDHIAGGGQAHRRSIGVRGGTEFYRWLRQQGFPEGYRVLCRNCNWIARLEAKNER